MRAHGAELPDVGATAGDYDDFYKKAFADIAERIKKIKHPLCYFSIVSEESD